MNRGIEADLSYYVDAAKVAAFDAALAKRSGKIQDYPNPDLAAEVDISRPKIDRQGIYAALQVSEVWRVFEEHVSIEQLQSDGKYVAAEQPVPPCHAGRRGAGSCKKVPEVA